MIHQSPLMESHEGFDLFASAIYAKTAFETWNDLKETYDKVYGSAVLPPSTCDAAKHFDQHNQLIKLMQFLMVISGEESHRNISSTRTTKPAATAFVDKTFDNNKKMNFNSNSRHVTSNNASADLHSNGVSSNNATTSNSLVSLSSEQFARLMNLLNENGVSTANANMAGLTVGHPNGTQALITKIGDLKINNEVTLYDVLVDLKENRTVGIGKQYNGLYLFDVDNACNIVSNSCIASCFVSKTLWHQRLGHLADQVLDVLKTTLNLDSYPTSDHLCDTCNKAKQTREPFPLSNHKSTKIGELVHLDV
ncbi:ribonuclease H-like domain-containing protein [Tanacetum coccineum]